jgi:hypothetical protein
MDDKNMGNTLNYNAESDKTSRFTPYPADCELENVHLIGFVDYAQLGLDEYPNGQKIAVGLLEDGRVELHKNFEIVGFISAVPLGGINELTVLLQLLQRFRLQDPVSSSEVWIADPRLPFYLRARSAYVDFLERDLEHDGGIPKFIFDTITEIFRIPYFHFDAFVSAITRFAYSTIPELLKLGSFFDYPASFDPWLDRDSTAGQPITGVYFLSSGSNIFYIGQSTDCHARIAQHRKAGKIPFTTAYTHPCPKDKLDDFEAVNIMHFKPRYNKELPENKLLFKEFFVLYHVGDFRRL